MTSCHSDVKLHTIKASKLEVKPIFSFGLGFDEAHNELPLARKIFADNAHLMQGDEKFKTNFIVQSPSKNVINEEYAVAEDIERIKKVILDKGIEFLKSSGFYMENYNYEIKNLWLNQMSTGSMQVSHSHYGYIVSGCYYIDMPAGCQRIKFINPNRSFIPSIDRTNIIGNQFNSAEFTMSPREGEMIFWFSMLEHAVPPEEFNGLRRSIAFDITVSGIK
jgi:uncharacterized protein (TIGR02466 family)